VDDAGAVIHGAGLTALELGPISSVLNGVEDEEYGAIMLDGVDPKPPPKPPPKPLPLADGAIVVECCEPRLDCCVGRNAMSGSTHSLTRRLPRSSPRR